MKYVSEITEAELSTLESAHKNHPVARVRNRGHVIILSNTGYQIKEIVTICRISRYAVSRAINRWEKYGLRGLYDKNRSGRTRILTPEDEDFVNDMVKKHPRSINRIVGALEEERGKKVSKKTVKRVIKKDQNWKRIRKSLKSKRDEKDFRRGQERINNKEEKRLQGEIDVQYFDGSGFDLNPCLPYAWQPKGEHIEVPAAKSQRLNVLGFMNKDNDFTPFTFKCNIDSDVVIACFDYFSERVTKKTFVYIDNAPVHRSKKFLSCLPGWHKKGLNVKFLPKYSPELNLIEILWQKIKYAWLPFSAYTSFKKLTECVESILANFGSRYTIQFS
jgi:transposase